jgi:signal transduction histidine kinase
MRMLTTFTRLQAKVEDKDAAKGLVYVWWIPLFCVAGQIVSLVVAFVQRDQMTALQIAAVLALVLVPAGFMWLSDWWVPWWLDLIAVYSAVAVIMSTPAVGVGAADAVSWVLMFTVSKYAATEGFRIGTVTALAAAGLMVAASALGHLDGLGMHLTITALGLVAGAMLHTQSRALAAERSALAGEHDRATMAERNRIAREIHDLVAHSLSITMLHITGARRMLADGDDVEEAIAALRDAELVGRQAMNDIRQTVGELATENAANRPLPSVDDLPELVESVRGAGLVASYTADGDTSRLAPSAGLGLYRIVQESLANVAKHAPGSPAHVSLSVAHDEAHLTVRSTRTRPQAVRDDRGNGIVGMTARAAQLGGTISAGPMGESWVVDLSVPLARVEDEASHDCAIRRVVGGATTSEPHTQPRLEPTS